MKFSVVRLHVKYRSEIPDELKTKTGWRKLGYKVKKGSPYIKCSWWNGMYYHNYKLYHKDHTEPIAGKKAAARRG